MAQHRMEKGEKGKTTMYDTRGRCRYAGCMDGSLPVHVELKLLSTSHNIKNIGTQRVNHSSCPQGVSPSEAGNTILTVQHCAIQRASPYTVVPDTHRDSIAWVR